MTVCSPAKKLITCSLACLLLSGSLFAEDAKQEAADSGQSSPAALTITVAKPQTAQWPVEVTASGWITAWQEAVISAEIGQQKVIAVNADVGEKVKEGDVLVELSRESLENDLAEQQASVDSSEAALEQAKADADRARQLQGSGSVSQQQIVEYLVSERKAKADVESAQAKLASAKLDLKRTRILAVSNGTISSRSAALGDVVAQGAEMFKMIRDNRVEWQAEVPLIQLRDIKIGTPVEIPTPVDPVRGRVRQIAPSASDTNGRVKVYVALDKRDDAFEPKTGVMVTGTFEIGERKAISVPTSAIVQSDGFTYVFVLDSKDRSKVSRVKVTTDRREDDRVELVDDFDENSEVVQSGGAFLADGSTVEVVEQDGSKTTEQSKQGTGE
ncbi:efflux RND transporter periplasmic adaptor subunit [Rhizobium halophytocola]|uniref:RND family efflux transporter MFP subunit n=1 Tax=Rhizobium halophytocola TaxID=735519 RepID=A0ABS4E4N7_9HYPH|nr:efflux RND transporter periplasmic adaptor subunit [Rhizobium halophytocola]MBP1852876.1 RND family efflux transporter MFP subunit [Rhizobium halophytocola]